MTGRTIGALPNCLAGLALGGFIVFAGVHPVMAQWLSPWPAPAPMAQWSPPWGAAGPPGDIQRRLAAQGYRLMAPLQRRPGIYLADVRAGPAGYQRLVIDARSGDILERFTPPPRSFGPEFAVGNDGFASPAPLGAVQPTPGPGFSGAPSAKSAYSGPANVRIPSAVSPFGSQLAPSSMRPKSKSAPTGRLIPSTKGAPPTASPPLPPPAPPREAVKPDELPPPAAAPEPKIDSSPGDVEHASTTEPAESAPPQAAAPELKIVSPPSETEDASTASSLAPEPKPEAAKVEPQRETQTPPAGPPPAPASSAELSEKSKVSIVPAVVSE